MKVQLCISLKPCFKPSQIIPVCILGTEKMRVVFPGTGNLLNHTPGILLHLDHTFLHPTHPLLLSQKLVLPIQIYPLLIHPLILLQAYHEARKAGNDEEVTAVASLEPPDILRAPGLLPRLAQPTLLLPLHPVPRHLEPDPLNILIILHNLDQKILDLTPLPPTLPPPLVTVSK